MPDAPSRIEKQYSIPRNRLIPDPSASDILISGPLFKTPKGKAEGFAMPLTRVAGSQAAPQKPGRLFYFRTGRVYVFDEERTAASLLFEGAAVAAKFALPGVADLTGGTSKFVEKVGDAVLEKAGEAARAPAHRPQATLAGQLSVLESRGVVVLPGVNVVDVEYRREPAGFLSKEIHQLTYSYEGLDGQRRSYQVGGAMKGDKGPLAHGAIDTVLTERMSAELEWLMRTIKAEFAHGFDAIEAELRLAFERQHGEGSAEDNLDFARDVNQRYEAETERNGFTSVKFGGRGLELLEPMREVYDRTPILAGMMQDLRAFAAGPPL